MIISNATIADIRRTNGGGRSKNVPVGFAGFQCRSCDRGRFFPTAVANLNSAVNNAFYNHVVRCDGKSLDDLMKKELERECKRHNAELASLVRGSQTRFYKVIWERLRAADNLEQGQRQGVGGDGGGDDDRIGKVGSGNGTACTTTIVEGLSRGDNEGTAMTLIDILKDKENEGSTVPAPLSPPPLAVLLLRQLNICHVKPYDVAARNYSRGALLISPIASASSLSLGYTGLCCRLCQRNNARYFPEKWQNLRSGLLYSFYQHITKGCDAVTAHVKNKIVEAAQNNIISGTRTRLLTNHASSSSDDDVFFQELYDRLRQKDEQNDTTADTTTLMSSQYDPTPPPDDAGSLFIRTAGGYYTCLSCHNVPLNLRGKYCLYSHAPSFDEIERHRVRCTHDKFCLDAPKRALEGMMATIDNFDQNSIVGESFKNVVRVLVRNNESLVNVFTHGALSDHNDNEGNDVSTLTSTDTNADNAWNKSGLWKELKKEMAVPNADVNDLKTAVLELGMGLEENDYFWDYVRLLRPSCFC